MQSKDSVKSGNVIVVGAGMAGLAAAKELADNGFEVLVLESRSRPGGRIWTDHTLDVPIDLGAAWIHGKVKNPIYELCRKSGIKTAPSSFANACLIDDNGKTVAPWKQMLYAGRANRILPRLKRLAKRLDNDISLADGVRMILEESGMKNQELSFLNRHLIEFEALNGASLEEQSLFALTDGAIAFQGGDLVFPDGFAQVFEHMARGIHIRYREAVVSVKHHEHGATVETSKGTYDADAVVITLPLGVLKSGRVQFSPPLPDFMQSSIAKIKMGLFNKIAMRFSETFWDPNCDMIEQVPVNRDIVCQIINWRKYSKEPILIACIAADTARLWEREANDEIESRMDKLLKKLFGNSASKPIATTITRWGQDEFALGAYTVVEPGATAHQFDALAEPAGRLFFAGEATDRVHQGTVPGAYLSGIRAARQICGLALSVKSINLLLVLLAFHLSGITSPGFAADESRTLPLKGEVRTGHSESYARDESKDPFSDDSSAGSNPANDIDSGVQEVTNLAPGSSANVDLYYRQGVVAEQSGDLATALENYVIAVNNDPVNPEFQEALHRLELKFKGTYPAFHAYTSYFTGKHDARLLLNYGVRLFSIGCFQQSENLFNKAVLLDPSNPNGFFDLGVIYEHNGELSKALNKYKKSLSLFKLHGADLAISAQSQVHSARAKNLKGSISKMNHERRRYSGMEDPKNGPELAQAAVNSILQQMKGKPSDVPKWPTLGVTQRFSLAATQSGRPRAAATRHVDTCDHCLILRTVEMWPN